MHKDILLSVIICTYNRSGFLKLVLDSLTRQTVSKNDYEIIIVDDGSADDTRGVVQNFKPLLPLTYFYQKNAGLAAAKNHGIFASRGEIVLFLDDDDIAIPTLLDEHIRTHRKYSEQHMAVLHYTNWAQDLVITPLMHFITEVGCFLFSYPHIKHGDILDYTYFWGGRSSCKRGFLLENGVFNQAFRFGCEDIELGYRLSKFGLKVVGFWTDEVGVNNRLTYILAFDGMAQCEKAWAAFRADPERAKAFAETEKEGPLVIRVTNTIMRPTAYSPMQ